jgi:hypothetical protein
MMNRFYLLLILATAGCRSEFEPDCEPGAQGCLCTVDELCLEGLACTVDGVCELDPNLVDDSAGTADESTSVAGTGDSESTDSGTGDGDGDGSTSGDGDGDGSTSGDGDGPSPYYPCESPDDCDPMNSGLDQCVGVSQSFGIVDVPSSLAPPVGFCTHQCTSSSQCPADAAATSAPRCLEGLCMLDCTATLASCPDGQACHPQIDVQGTTTDYDLCGP